MTHTTDNYDHLLHQEVDAEIKLMGDYLKEHVNHFIAGLQIAARSYIYALHIINRKYQQQSTTTIKKEENATHLRSEEVQASKVKENNKTEDEKAQDRDSSIELMNSNNCSQGQPRQAEKQVKVYGHKKKDLIKEDVQKYDGSPVGMTRLFGSFSQEPQIFSPPTSATGRSNLEVSPSNELKQAEKRVKMHGHNTSNLVQEDEEYNVSPIGMTRLFGSFSQEPKIFSPPTSATGRSNIEVSPSNFGNE